MKGNLSPAMLRRLMLTATAFVLAYSVNATMLLILASLCGVHVFVLWMLAGMTLLLTMPVAAAVVVSDLGQPEVAANDTLGAWVAGLLMRLRLFFFSPFIVLGVVATFLGAPRERRQRELPWHRRAALLMEEILYADRSLRIRVG
jgi:hypothetical protein